MSGWMAAAQIGGDLLGSYLGYKGQKDANDMNYRIAKEQMDFQERMSNTSWQRSVADMRAAGINPLMAAFKGGASSPAGASAHMENEMSIPAHNVSSMVGRVNQIMAQQAEVKRINADARLTNAEASLREARIPHSAATAQAETDKIQEEVVRLGQDIEKADLDIAIRKLDIKGGELSNKQVEALMPYLIRASELQNKMLELGLPAAEAEAAFWKALPEAAWVQKLREILPTITLGGRGSAVRSLPAPSRSGDFGRRGR